jgi:NitT/TauT family transport system permease protein
MSRADAPTPQASAPAAPSAQYRDWLRRERRNRLTVRAAQLALLVAFLVAWEVLPRAQIINPLFTSYPSAIWPTFLEMLKATPQQPGILTHTWGTVLATVVGFTAAMLIGIAIASMLWWWANSNPPIWGWAISSYTAARS